MRRLDRATREMNPFLLALAIGLLVLNLTCLAALKLSPPPTDAGRTTTAIAPS
jgi:hypothetical protein